MVKAPEDLAVKAYFRVVAAEKARDAAKLALSKAQAAAKAAAMSPEEWFASDETKWVLLPVKETSGPFADLPLWSASRNRPEGSQITESHSNLQSLRRICEATDVRLAAQVKAQPPTGIHEGVRSA